MIHKNIDEKNKMIFIFAGFYVSSAILLILIFTVFWNSSTSNTKNTRLSGDEQAIQLDNFLQEHLTGIQYLDKKFAALLIDSGIKTDFDTTFNKIRKAELTFRNAIDSMERTLMNERNTGRLGLIISSYKSALENRKPMDDIQQGITLGSKQIRNDQQTLLKFKNDLLKRDSSLSQFNERLKSGSKERYTVSFPSSDYKLLNNENKYLKSELKLMEAKLASERNAKNTPDDETLINVKLNESSKSSSNSKLQRNGTKTGGYGSTK